MLINVDFDGVLVSNTYEKLLNEKSKVDGLSFDDCSVIWDWYEHLVINPLDLNIQLLQFLEELRNEGHCLRLWTNRAYTLKKQTLNNLNDWTRLFDSFEFYNGRKPLSKVEGIAIDNDIPNLSCAELGGIHYEWKGV